MMSAMTTGLNAPGADNSKWIGDEARYPAAHKRVRKARGPASTYPCRSCAGPAADWAYDHLDPNERVDAQRGLVYSLDIDHYMPLCKSCHGKLDKWRDTACPQGHERTPANTYYNEKKGWRDCLPCRRERSLAWQKNNRELHNSRRRKAV